jgi:AcrR family transcriptional regulator
MDSDQLRGYRERMGRRSDHSREQLRELILATGQALMAEAGFARFSAREVAKRIGYTIGTIYNVFGSHDALLIAINSRTFLLWTEWMRAGLEGAEDRIAALVHGYFSFAQAHPNLWNAIYDHHLPAGLSLPPEEEAVRGTLTELIAHEVAGALGREPDKSVHTLVRSLIATVHGHCAFALSGAWALMGEDAPESAALARVREALERA